MKKLDYWKEKLNYSLNNRGENEYQFDEREELFRGCRSTKPCVKGDKPATTPYLRNIVSDIIETEVDSNIPMPKVTARYKEDEHLAEIIEAMLREEMDRLSFEEINDLMERIVPVQGGGWYFCEWDQSNKSHDTFGELWVCAIHPREVIPQPGVYNSVDDMEYIFLALPQTAESIKRSFGKDITKVYGNGNKAKDIYTQYTAYYRNDEGGIGKFSWVDDTVLEDEEDFRSRRVDKCKLCDAIAVKGKCPICGGSDLKRETLRFEEFGSERVSSHGVMIPALSKVPFYKPDVFPLVLQRNVSVYGQLLGESDVDKIKDQQNLSNRLSTKILDNLLKAGSFATLPVDATIRTDNENMKYIRLENAADKSLIDVYDMEGSIAQDMALYQEVYEEARQIIGITDSYQGRRDTTATSGKAKEISVSQSAGRLESKRVMKQAAYARLFEIMFKLKLAYADEIRPVASRSCLGERGYDVFDRYDFLRRDKDGEWYWNDRFNFSCDTAASLASNREAMWDETRMNLQTGAYGNPADPETLILFWSKMEELHYPGSAATLSYLQSRLKQSDAQAESALNTLSPPEAGSLPNPFAINGPSSL